MDKVLTMSNYFNDVVTGHLMTMITRLIESSPVVASEVLTWSRRASTTLFQVFSTSGPLGINWNGDYKTKSWTDEWLQLSPNKFN